MLGIVCSIISQLLLDSWNLICFQTYFLFLNLSRMNTLWLVLVWLVFLNNTISASFNSLTIWVPRDVYISHERISSVPLWRIRHEYRFELPQEKNFSPRRLPLVKKLKSTIYNIIMFINLLQWHLYKLFWKKYLFVSISYIIWVLQKSIWVWYIMKHGAGHNPGWSWQFLQW